MVKNKGWEAASRRVERHLRALFQAPKGMPPHWPQMGHGRLTRSEITLSMAGGLGRITRVIEELATVGEAVHAASLVHDDIIDRAPLRRGRPSVVGQVGPDRALVFGDWLLARALQFAHRRLPERVCREISSVLRGMCQALWLELNSAGLAGWTLNRYLRLADGKTAAWFKFLAAQAALLAGAPPVRCAAAARFGLLFGRFFQIRDDLMDTVADPNGAGKPLLGDARHLRPNLPLILAITNEPVANRDSREKWLADPRRTPGQVAAWLERQGVLTRLPRILAVQRQRMLHALAEALPEGAARQELENRVQAYYAVLGFPLDRVGAVLQIKKKNQKKTTTKASRRRYYDRSKTPGG